MPKVISGLLKGRNINGYDILYVKGLISEDEFNYSSSIYNSSDCRT